MDLFDLCTLVIVAKLVNWGMKLNWFLTFIIVKRVKMIYDS